MVRLPARHKQQVRVDGARAVHNGKECGEVAPTLDAELAAVFTGECRQYAAKA